VIDVDTPIPQGDCILWDKYINHWRGGYGQSSKGPAHRMVYEKAYGPIAPDIDIDHVCFNPACVNLDHLRPLPRTQNRRLQRSKSKTKCKHGHEFTPENTIILRPKSGGRACRLCMNARQRQYQTRKREQRKQVK
jgi:hypothetical protein